MLIKIANQYNGQETLQKVKKQFKKCQNKNNVIFQRETCIQSGRWIGLKDNYDLILSDLQLHLSQNNQDLLNGYKDSLQSDGALVGSCFGQGTLKQLYWAYLMAQNQRSGGVSPKVATFPSMGIFGSLLTGCHYTLSTVMNKQFNVQYESIIDLLSVIQELGQSGYLFGRRKGIYKDVFLAMTAMYHGQFQAKNKEINLNFNIENFDENGNFLNKNKEQSKNINKQQKNIINGSKQNTNIIAGLQLLSFIGWKYDQKQPKALRRGQMTTVGSKSFLDQLKQQDPDFKHFVVQQDSDQIKKIR